MIQASQWKVWPVPLFNSGRLLIIIILTVLMTAALTNHLLSKGIHCGYELKKKHFDLFI